ncbi:nitroreductase family protein [Deinococcus radiophilus]|uniref:nitroreductase family protein n=1 Tax=Deinococcus radiophilus TaxID=32062 RepID=UPI001E4B03E3|nr:nitroreductase family protein [Deinococcus radiophilus]UFA51246.1 nitroreductase family protein [Deinococcus radiophilus]
MPETVPDTRALTPQQVRDFFGAHRTVRQYRTQDGQPIPLPEDHLDAVLYAAQRAPTHSTSQLYSIIQVQGPAQRAELAELAGNAHIATAGAAFVLCADLHRIGQILALDGTAVGDWADVANHFAVGDAVMAGQNLLTAAEMLGYQGCWIGGVLNNLPQIAEVLELPAGVLPFSALTIGLPDEQAPYRPRLHREVVVHTDRYRLPERAEMEANIEHMNPIAARGDRPGDWARLLRMYWGAGGAMEKRQPDLQAVKRRQGLG